MLFKEFSLSIRFDSLGNYGQMQALEQFSNLCALYKTEKGGFFLRKKPLNCCGFGV